MVLFLLLSLGLPHRSEAISCCVFAPPNISLLGPPPKPPWLKLELSCNGKGGINSAYSHSSIEGGYSTSTAGSALAGGELAAVVLSFVLLFFIVFIIILFIFYKKKHGYSYQKILKWPWFKISPEPAKCESDGNFLYNYRVLGRQWRASRNSLRGRGLEDKHSLIASTPATSHMSLSTDGGHDEEKPEDILDGKLPDQYSDKYSNQNGSETSGIGHSEGSLPGDEIQEVNEQLSPRKKKNNFLSRKASKDQLASEELPPVNNSQPPVEQKCDVGGVPEVNGLYDKKTFPLLAPLKTTHVPIYPHVGYFPGQPVKDIDTPSTVSGADNGPTPPTQRITLEPITHSNHTKDKDRTILRKKRTSSRSPPEDVVAMDTMNTGSDNQGQLPAIAKRQGEYLA